MSLWQNTPPKSDFWRDIFILAHSSKGASPSWQGRWGIKEQLTSWQPGNRERMRTGLFRLFVCLWVFLCHLCHPSWPELILWTRLAHNPQRSTCLRVSSAEMKCVCHHAGPCLHPSSFSPSLPAAHWMVPSTFINDPLWKHPQLQPLEGRFTIFLSSPQPNQASINTHHCMSLPRETLGRGKLKGWTTVLDATAGPCHHLPSSPV